jgi:hypothetical protein
VNGWLVNGMQEVRGSNPLGSTRPFAFPLPAAHTAFAVARRVLREDGVDTGRQDA